MGRLLMFKAHSPQAEFTRLESKEDIMSMINAL